MSTSTETIERLANQEYKFGFVTDIEQEVIPKGLDEGVVRLISAKKKEPEWMLEWRLKAYERWLEMEEPTWHNVKYPPIDYQEAHYYAAPKSDDERPKSLDEIDPEILATYEKLGIPLHEQQMLAGVAVDAVFDSVSVATTFKEKLGELGIIFCSFSDAVQNHPDLVKKYLGSVVPAGDNFFAALNAAVFSDGSFVYIPKGVRCPMELSTYFRINAMNTGQFERTLIVAAEGSHVSYLEGCTAPMRDENQLHAAVVELVALDEANIKYSTVQNWYPGDKNGKGGIYNFVTKRGLCSGRNSKISWTQVETGSSITWKYPEMHPPGRQLGRREFYSVALTNNCQQADTGTKMIHIGKRHTEHHHLQGHFGRPGPEHLSRPGKDPERRQRGAQELLPVRLHAPGGSLRRPHVPLPGRPESEPPRMEHEASTSKIGEDQIFYCQQRGIPDTEDADIDDRQRILQGRLPEVADGIRCRGAEAT